MHRSEALQKSIYSVHRSNVAEKCYFVYVLSSKTLQESVSLCVCVCVCVCTGQKDCVEMSFCEAFLSYTLSLCKLSIVPQNMKIAFVF